MKNSEKELFLELLSKTKSLEKLYQKIQTWLEDSLQESPLIFYRPLPLEDYSFGGPNLARPVFLRGEGSLENISINKLRNNQTGLLDLSNSLYHLEKNNRWFGAIETKGEKTDFVENNKEVLLRFLTHAVDYHQQKNQARISRWYQQLTESLHSPEGYNRLYNLLTEIVGNLLGTSEVAFYTSSGDDYQLETCRGFDPEDLRERRSIPGEQFTSLELEQSEPIMTEPRENSSSRNIYIPIQSKPNRRGLVVAFEVKNNVELSNLKKYLLETLSDLAYIILSQLELTTNKSNVFYDRLTGLHTGDYFRRRLNQEVEKGHRYGLNCSLIVFDIDNFSQLNNELGQQGGDAILREFGRLLKSCFRDVDIPCRFTNDEFGILFPNTGIDGARQAAKRFHSLVEKPIFKTQEKFIKVKVSGGLAGYPQNGENGKELLKKARLALYEAKKTGRNKVVRAGSSEAN
ncbi:MAG: GGDEF domain-containing protein [bacterium]